MDNWSERIKGAICKTCISFVPKGEKEVEGKGIFGRCRKHSPTMNGFPVVWSTDWCGDHKLDENKI